MSLESFNFIDSLNASNPTTTDNVSEGDDHIRGIKSTLKTTFPSINAAITATDEEINLLDGVTATTAELNYVDGVTSNIQTQLGTKLPLAGGTMTGTIAGFTSTGIDDNATSTKLTVANTGIDVTGSVTCDGLTVSATGSSYPTISHSNGNLIQLQPSYNYYNAFEHVFKSLNGTSEHLRIASSGNVGIGTTSPDARLQSSISDADATPVNGTDNHKARSGHSLEVFNESASASYSGIHLRTRNSGASAWSMNNVWKSTYVGDLTFVSRTAGSTTTENVRFLNEGGITFNGDTAAANALDDYETGTFDVTLLCDGNSVTHSCSYTKIGNMVTVDFAYTGTSSTYWSIFGASGDAVTITSNLPFTPTVNGGFACNVTRSLANGNDLCVGWRAGSAGLYLGTADQNNYQPTNNATKDTTQSNITIQGSGSYVIA